MLYVLQLAKQVLYRRASPPVHPVTAVCNVLATSANRAPSACAKKGQQNMALKALYSVFGGHKRWLKSNQDFQGPKQILDSNLDGQKSLSL